MSTTYRIKGINDEQDTCTACGRQGLKRVVWLAEVDADGFEGEARHYGTDCAGQMLHGRKTSGNTAKVAKAAETVVRTAEQLARCEAVLAEREADGGRAYGERLFALASLRRAEGATVESLAAEGLADIRSTVADLRAQLAAATVEVAA